MPSRLFVIFATLAASTGCLIAAEGRADEPFFYYPAYGAQRGKIVYRDGPRVDRQKIRWGNGLTPQGAAVLGQAITAFAPIVGAAIKEDPAAAEEAPRSRAAHERALADDDVLLQRALGLRADNEQLARAFGLTVASSGSSNGPSDAGSFNNWDNGGPPATGGQTPPSPAGAGGLENWDNGGAAPATPMGGATAPPSVSGAAGFADWDNR